MPAPWPALADGLPALVAAHPGLAFKTANMDDGRNPDVGLMLPSGQIKFALRALCEGIDEELQTGAVGPVPRAKIRPG